MFRAALAKTMDTAGDAARGTSKLLTKFDEVYSYVPKNGNLLDNFITKVAEALGWVP